MTLIIIALIIGFVCAYYVTFKLDPNATGDVLWDAVGCSVIDRNYPYRRVHHRFCTYRLGGFGCISGDYTSLRTTHVGSFSFRQVIVDIPYLITYHGHTLRR